MALRIHSDVDAARVRGRYDALSLRPLSACPYHEHPELAEAWALGYQNQLARRHRVALLLTRPGSCFRCGSGPEHVATQPCRGTKRHVVART